MTSARTYTKNIISEDPLVYTIDDVLTPEECDHFIELAKPTLAPSLVSTSNKGVTSSGRTSTNTWLVHDTDDVTKVCGERIAGIVEMPLENSEKYQVVHYDVSQEYRQHYDSWDHNGSEKTLRCMKYGGARLLTALVYLSDVEAGGGTRMTKLDHTVSAKKGRLLVFENTHRGTNLRHELTEHAGMPVEAGEKYIFNLWFKECKSSRLYSEFNPQYYETAAPVDNISLKVEEVVKAEEEATGDAEEEATGDCVVLNEDKELLLFRGFAAKHDVTKLRIAAQGAGAGDGSGARPSQWVKYGDVSSLTTKAESAFGIKRRFFENINVVEYAAEEVHHRHFMAYDLASERGQKYTAKLGQRVYTIMLALSDNMSVAFPTIGECILMNTGDMLCYKNVIAVTNMNRDAAMERQITNRGDAPGQLATISVRARTNRGESLTEYLAKLEEMNGLIEELPAPAAPVAPVATPTPTPTEAATEDYGDTLTSVFAAFDAKSVDHRWSGHKSFKYLFKGDFEYFGDCIRRYSALRSEEPCLNPENLARNYELDPELPIQIVNNVVTPSLLTLLQEYYRKTIDSNTWMLGDRQSNRYKAHNEPMSRFLHYETLPLIEKIVGKALRPTYTYLSAYVKGAELPPHTDRPDCEYTVSFVVDKPAGSQWDIYVHRPRQPVKHKGRYPEQPPVDECEAVDCEAGGLMLFQGTDHIHFREALTHDYYNILLLHYCAV